MTAESIMSFRLIKLKPNDTVSHALHLMHTHQIRNLPIVGEDDEFIGLFGLRKLIHLLLPKAAQIEYGLKDLSFMPDELGELYERSARAGERPVSDFMESRKKHLLFCKPSTTFPEVLELLNQSRDFSVPVIVVKGKKQKLVGMVSAWDVLEKMVINVFLKDQDGASEDESSEDRAEEPGDEATPRAENTVLKQPD